MSIKLSLPFSAALDDDEILGAGESGAGTAISDGADKGLRFTPEDWESIIEALYGIEAIEEPNGTQRSRQARILPGASTWEID